ncbi:MAG: DNA-directed RNA polymerase subunit beta' [Parcubacteria group bacterium GW2011_GWA2_38_13]|nr:MAG: DNA-directed RNA polymerase subunit beta' [Parcubacteria group bacterium GW2011_GWA2_38_13]
MFNDDKKTLDFDALRLSLASPDKMLVWSRGEVTKPETVNYRTQKPERDGLFDERIFGPSKDWECYCGKYKKIRYKGIVCDKCGVEVTRSIVRRERMGHIKLASPCSHIWFLRGVPSKIGLILDLSPQALERVIYFADFIIIKVDNDLKKSTIEQIKQEFKAKKKKIEDEFNREFGMVKGKVMKENPGKSDSDMDERVLLEMDSVKKMRDQKFAELEEIVSIAEQELKDLKVMRIISEQEYQDLSLKYGHIFEASIGAEAVRELLERVDLAQFIRELEEKLLDAHGQVKEKVIKRLRLAKNLENNKIRPEWMILTIVPIIPPDLRPMVPLDGGRFATSDLNDLYRRIINRNNRLKQLVELNAPEVICRNEKRMLQEAVDALIDNSARHGKTVVASTGQKRMLKSLADVLRGKQGRFRQNLLGKRIDYSGRSVIVVGPKLKLHQCGIPKKMALELFKPFIISKLIKQGLVHNVKSASRYIESGKSEVWDILEEIVKGAYVLLNRAPTLHRLGIQAFKPILIEGKALQIHPLVCAAFNADFDGDQMAVHVPLTEMAKWEAGNIMLSSKNLLKPATGDPIANPSKDMVWGIYYITSMVEPKNGKVKAFPTSAEAIMAYNYKQIRVCDKIKVRVAGLDKEVFDENSKKMPKEALLETTVGRIIFNQVLPKDHIFMNQMVGSSGLKNIISAMLSDYSQFEKCAEILDDIKALGFKYLTKSGYSWGMDDVPMLEEKRGIVREGEDLVSQIEDQFDMGLLTESERHTKIIETWMKAKDKVVGISKKALDPQGSIYSMVESGARGSWGQLIQIMGMKGLVTNPRGDIIELPVKGNFKEGFDVLEYFISTHGARKGLSDTALRTANAGYLTRRLVDVAQDVVITAEDCHDEEGYVMRKKDCIDMGVNIIDRVLYRIILETINDPHTKKPVIKSGELITPEISAKLKLLDLAEIKIRSLITCKNRRGACQKCYGYDLGYNKMVDMGTAVGIIAAQSIGEPGTQLTMRTFHTGGVAGLDITQGLPRVEEIFECRTPKMKAFMTEVAGTVTIENPKESDYTKKKIIKISYPDTSKDSYHVKHKDTKKGKNVSIEVKDGQKVGEKTTLFLNSDGEKVLAHRPGVVRIEGDVIEVIVDEYKTKDYAIPPEYHITVKNGDLVAAGDSLTDGNLDLRQMFKLKDITTTQRYVVKEIQNIYTSQGQKLNDKHIEIIARQMFSRVYVKEAGDTDFLAGSRVEWREFEYENDRIKKLGKKPAEGERLLLGITKVSLSTNSFLSAASFQETSRVLIDAAVQGRMDRLEGLKENVIIGRLIPAGTGFKVQGK